MSSEGMVNYGRDQVLEAHWRPLEIQDGGSGYDLNAPIDYKSDGCNQPQDTEAKVGDVQACAHYEREGFCLAALRGVD